MRVIRTNQALDYSARIALQKYMNSYNARVPIQRINRLVNQDHDERESCGGRTARKKENQKLTKLVYAQLTGIGHILDKRV